MKTLYFLALIVVAVSALPIDSEDERVNGENGWYVPQDDGSFEWVSKEEGEKYLDSRNEMSGRSLLSPVTFYLYTKTNPTEGQVITTAKKTIKNSNFNAINPTRIIIHGWKQSFEADMNVNIRDAYLSTGNFNIIVVDWGRARSYDYASSVVAVEGVGKQIAQLVDVLVKTYKLNLDDLHVVGHSLGAHVAGHTGKNIESGQVHTIVGLDTAMPLFSYDKPENRLSSDDAYYVESIHTNGGELGFLKPIGKGAFYPNGGKSQPGCGIDLTGACSHARSTQYYAEAILSNTFPAVKCEQYEDAISKSCGSTYSSVRMASKTNAYVVSGEYYVPVNKASPFGLAA